jgi:hypothetical protein
MENQIDQLLKMKDLINKIQIDYNNQVITKWRNLKQLQRDLKNINPIN